MANQALQATATRPRTLNDLLNFNLNCPLGGSLRWLCLSLVVRSPSSEVCGV
jgi:hypothetical protein